VIDMIDYQDDSPDESEADPIDADLVNADWPKRSRDSQSDIDERLASYPKSASFIHGVGWFAWFDIDKMDWDADSGDAPVGMLREEFNAGRVTEYVDGDKSRDQLYADAVEFLNKWGVKATVVS
jgi:hypothetical protein